MRAKVAAEHAGGREGQIVHPDAADQQTGQFRAGQTLHPGTQVVPHPHADVISGDAVVENPGARVGNVQRLTQQRHRIQHLDPFAAHDIGKVGVILDRLFDPEHIVEQQVFAIFRRQTAMRQAGWRYDHLPQCTGFGMNAQFWFRHLECLLLSNQRMAARLIPAEMKTTRISSRGQTKTTQRSNDTRPMARPPITTAEVGVIRFTSPLAD